MYLVLYLKPGCLVSAINARMCMALKHKLLLGITEKSRRISLQSRVAVCRLYDLKLTIILFQLYVSRYTYVHVTITHKEAYIYICVARGLWFISQISLSENAMCESLWLDCNGLGCL